MSIRTLDSRDLQNELEELESDLFDLTRKWEDLVDELAEMRADSTDDDIEELELQVKAKAEEIEDWKGDNQERLDDLKQLFTCIEGDCTLILEDDFKEYVQDMADDIVGDIPGWLVVDWEATVRDVKTDYASVEFDGESWLVR